MSRLENRIRERAPELRSKGQWNSGEGDILFGDMGAKPTSNWYIVALARDGASTVGEDGRCELNLKLIFKVDVRAPIALRKRATMELDALFGREDSLAETLGIGDAGVTIDPERRELTALYRRSGEAGALLEELEAHVRRLAAYFKDYFAVAGEGGASQC